MMPTADDVAAAIVAAAKETGADPVCVLIGLPAGSSTDSLQAVSRARAYAGRALDRVFNRPALVVPMPTIARMIGVSKPSWGSYFSSLKGRPLPWWNDAALDRVVEAVMNVDNDNVTPPRLTPPPYKDGPLPPVSRPIAQPGRIGTLEPAGFRPAPGTAAKILQDDDDDDERSVFDRGSVAPNVTPNRKVQAPASKRALMDDLRAAVENTARMTPKEE